MTVDLNKDNFNILNILAKHFLATAKSKGWRQSADLKMGESCSNLHSEISELWESWRANKLLAPCDKSEKMLSLTGESLNCAEEELADILIRTLEMAAFMELDIGNAARIKDFYNQNREFRHGGKLA